MFAPFVTVPPPCLPSPFPHRTSQINNINKNLCFSASFRGGTQTKTISNVPAFCIAHSPAKCSFICLNIRLIENSSPLFWVLIRFPTVVTFMPVRFYGLESSFIGYSFMENLLDEQVRSHLAHFIDEVELAQIG